LRLKSALAVLCSTSLLCTSVLAQQAQADSNNQSLQLFVLRGENAQNNIKKGRATKAVVEVRDRNNKPVAGAAVLFLLPDSGPGGSFVGGAQSATVTTDSAGQASVTYTPNHVAGDFNVRVTVKDSNVSASIHQRNEAAASAGLSTTAIVLLTVAAPP
jgi:Bacterial Ig-like domain (group 1)